METKATEKTFRLIDCIILVEVKLWLKFTRKFTHITKNYM
jgi:hypothetical protein